MPNYYAHLIFGRMVREALDPALLARVTLEGYYCGQFGPDPLFFHRLPLKTRLAAEGHLLHRTGPGIVLERLRAPARAGKPQALGFAAGYLCHFLLDAACHPYVYANASRKGLSHMAMEGEFDRFLMQRYDPMCITVRILPPDPAVFEAGALAFAHATPRAFRSATRAFARYCHTLARLAGSPICTAADLATRPSSFARGFVLRKAPHPLAAESNEALLRRMQDAVPGAVQAVGQLVACIDTGRPFDFLPAVDFAGRPLES